MRMTSLCLFCCLFAVSTLSAATQKNVYGLTEYVWLADFPVRVAAKLDTGAKTASLSAHDIERFKRGGETWVRFRLTMDHADDTLYERPLARISKIKRRAGDYDPEEDEKTYTARPVIELDLCMGHIRRSVEVNLTDRSAFQYPLLIGSDALERFDALIDPSLKYSAGKPDCNANDAE